jgi:hypothetical protein
MLRPTADAPEPCKNVRGKILSNSIACVANECIQLQPVVELLTCAARRGIAQSGSASALGAEALDEKLTIKPRRKQEHTAAAGITQCVWWTLQWTLFSSTSFVALQPLATPCD